MTDEMPPEYLALIGWGVSAAPATDYYLVERQGVSVETVASLREVNVRTVRQSIERVEEALAPEGYGKTEGSE